VRVFITGGAGFIGSHLCDALVAEGKEVTILDNLSTGSKKNIDHLEGEIKVFQGDIRDQKLVESLVAESDLVLHMAAALGVDNILENPIESISTNFYGSEVVLNTAAKYDKRIIIASTSEIYGMNPKQPLSETDDRIIGSPQKLRWSYSDAKALEEAAAYFLYLTKKLKVTTIRFQTNSKSEITFTDYKDAYAIGFEDMARRVPDISKLKLFTGWEPEIDLKTIITDVANHI